MKMVKTTAFKNKAGCLRMGKWGAVRRLILILFVLFWITGEAYAERKFVVIIIDGARYTETFGNPAHVYIPQMSALAQQGTYLTNFYNDSLTYTSRAIPALWCGSWTEVRDTVYNGISTKYAVKPTIFEYFRKQKNLPADQCFYVLKYIPNLWLPSFNTNYGPAYWPQYHSQDSTDAGVATQAQLVMNTYHPPFLWIYLADVDKAGHSGILNKYIRAIQTADSIVGVIWSALQADPFYQDSTTLFVTNDHGRHDDQHGGFQGHGDDCEGCRHIMFLALGAGIKNNFVSAQYRRIPDMAVTASAMLGLNAEFATGAVINEILQTTTIGEREPEVTSKSPLLLRNYPNPFNATTHFRISLSEADRARLEVFDLTGESIALLVNEKLPAGIYQVEFNASRLPSGLYICRLRTSTNQTIRKILLLR